MVLFDVPAFDDTANPAMTTAASHDGVGGFT
jgi:hypothetical protein